MRNKLSFLFLLTCFLSTFTFAQDSVRVDTSSIVDLRIPDESRIEVYTNDPSFQYSRAPENPNSLRDRLLNFLISILVRLIGNPVGEFIFKSILIIAVIGLVFVVINQLMGGELISIITKNKSGDGFSIDITGDELANTDFEKLLNDAIAKGDFHAATRYGYLISLRLLREKNLIQWADEKTNLDFLRELTGHPLNKPFRTLTTYYEYVEYGDFEIDSTRFKSFQSTLDEFKGAING